MRRSDNVSILSPNRRPEAVRREDFLGSQAPGIEQIFIERLRQSQGFARLRTNTKTGAQAKTGIRRRRNVSNRLQKHAEFCWRPLALLFGGGRNLNVRRSVKPRTPGNPPDRREVAPVRTSQNPRINLPSAEQLKKINCLFGGYWRLLQCSVSCCSQFAQLNWQVVCLARSYWNSLGASNLG